MKTMRKTCLIVCLSLFVLPSILLSAESSSNSDDFLKTKKSAEQGNAVAQCNLGVNGTTDACVISSGQSKSAFLVLNVSSLQTNRGLAFFQGSSMC